MQHTKRLEAITTVFEKVHRALLRFNFYVTTLDSTGRSMGLENVLFVYYKELIGISYGSIRFLKRSSLSISPWSIVSV